MQSSQKEESSDVKEDDAEIPKTVFTHEEVAKQIQAALSNIASAHSDPPEGESPEESSAAVLETIQESLQAAFDLASTVISEQAKDKESGQLTEEESNRRAAFRASWLVKYKEYMKTSKADRELFDTLKGISFRGTSLVELAGIELTEQKYLEHWDKLNKLLVQATRNGDNAEVSKLLKESADPNAYDENEENETALIIASANGNDAIVSTLLAAGADTNAQNLRGYTALMYAAENGHLKIVELLLAGGANVTIVNESKTSALDLAIDKGHSEVADFLQSFLASCSEIPTEVITHAVTTQYPKSPTTEDDVSMQSAESYADDESSKSEADVIMSHSSESSEDVAVQVAKELALEAEARKAAKEFAIAAKAVQAAKELALAADVVMVTSGSLPGIRVDVPTSDSSSVATESNVVMQSPDSDSVATESNVVMQSPDSSSVEDDMAVSFAAAAHAAALSAELPARESSVSPEEVDMAVPTGADDHPFVATERSMEQVVPSVEEEEEEEDK